MRVYVSSLGCKLNQSEMDTLAARLAKGGHQIVVSAAEADLCILNTCAVTHVAAQKSRQALRRLHRENPGAQLVVTGCYAELTPDDLRGLPAVKSVVGNQDKARLWETLSSDAPESPAMSPGLSGRTRALVKIQDGCDNACTYCIIRVARGPQMSLPQEDILTEIRTKLAAGHKEIVLTGVHIGAYGRDRDRNRDEPTLWSLVNRILTETDVARLRLSSIEPWDLPEQAFRLWTDRRLCRHIHLPLQSGSDSVLHRMARRYTTAEYTALVSAAREAIPDLAITTDVIIGFPGETEKEFAESLAFVEAMGFARTHVFPYSLRPGTPAARMTGQVASPVKAARAKAMRAAAANSDRAFRQQFIGRTMDVLWESSRLVADEPVWTGLTSNYLRVETSSEASLSNTLTATHLTALVGQRLRGTVEIENEGWA